MPNVYDVKASKLVGAVAVQLKSVIKKPGYINYVKSGANRERPPSDPDFWYARGASMLRQVYINGPVGVSKLRTRYGSRKEHSVHRRHHVRAGGSIIRDLFQELEKAQLVKTTKEGRVITPKGRSFMDKIAKGLEGGQAGNA
ncbi:MAG: 30S ribosomal protein S19e [Candidatus Marsarchaeota archaeon]|jgi:small subunit ribosomal protein S19e|nr:30S ribosomal protein S19e [Candidatus Marsarchaeota archaeon]MCL5115188.1 30S ribosomal protein S19e [Candidatus Marsarchaeota archaeon]